MLTVTNAPSGNETGRPTVSELLFILTVIAILAALGALAHVIGADSRDEIDDSHLHNSIRGSI